MIWFFFEDSIFKLDSKQRLRILNVFVQQLMSYHKFRAFSEDKISILTDLRKELKNLRNFDINQVSCFSILSVLLHLNKIFSKHYSKNFAGTGSSRSNFAL